MAQSEFFEIYISAFIKCILNFNKYYPTCGILGEVKAYYGIIETQGRGSLHLHLLLWLNTKFSFEEYTQLLYSRTFNTKLLEYLEDVIKCDLFDSAPNTAETTNAEHPCSKKPTYIRNYNDNLYTNDPT